MEERRREIWKMGEIKDEKLSKREEKEKLSKKEEKEKIKEKQKDDFSLKKN